MEHITHGDDGALIHYAQPIVAELRATIVRVDADFSATPFKVQGDDSPPRNNCASTQCWSPAARIALARWTPCRGPPTLFSA